MTIKELENVICGNRTYKIDSGCDYIDIPYADMVGTDDDGIKRNFVTWEKI